LEGKPVRGMRRKTVTGVMRKGEGNGGKYDQTTLYICTYIYMKIA
jgi:hypothetical protein